MKKFLVFTLLLAAGVSVSYAQSMLKISLTDNSRFNIMLNGRHFNKQGQSITVGDLPPGRQRLKIFVLRRDRWHGGVYEDLIYQGRVNTYYGNTTILRYDPDLGLADIQEVEGMQRPRRQPLTSRPDDRDANYYNNNDASPDNDDVAAQPLPSGSPAASPVSESKTGTLSNGKAEKLKSKADAKKTDTEKMKVLKDGLRNERLTTYNVSEIMDFFLFESSKVDFATWAYNMTVDPEYFRDLEAKLTSASAKQDLDNFIKAKQ